MPNNSRPYNRKEDFEEKSIWSFPSICAPIDNIHVIHKLAKKVVR